MVSPRKVVKLPSGQAVKLSGCQRDPPCNLLIQHFSFLPCITIIFATTARSLFDSDLVLSKLPTVLTGAVSLIFLKALTVAAATRVPRWLEPNCLETLDVVKLSSLLSSVGEFAFVVLALAEKLEVLPKYLGGLIVCASL